MKYKYKNIICSLLLCSTLSSSYAASDGSISSKMGLLKTAIIGVGLMVMPRPIDSSPSTDGFVGCYRGTIDSQKSISTNTLSINTISYSPCSYGPFHPRASDFKTKDIDMKMTVIPTYGEDKRVEITNIELTNLNFPVAYSGSFNWQPVNSTSLNSQFFLNIYDNQICTLLLGFTNNYGSCLQNGPGNNLFYKSFSAFMKS